jgi:hypothetical protein
MLSIAPHEQTAGVVSLDGGRQQRRTVEQQRPGLTARNGEYPHRMGSAEINSEPDPNRHAV